MTRSTAQETNNSRFSEDSCLHCSTGYLDNIARRRERRACRTTADGRTVRKKQTKNPASHITALLHLADCRNVVAIRERERERESMPGPQSLPPKRLAICRTTLPKISKKVVVKRELLMDDSEEEDEVWDSRTRIRPRKVRVICTDPDATDSSSEEEGSSGFRHNHFTPGGLQQRRNVQEIGFRADLYSPSSESDSEDEEGGAAEVPSYHSVFTATAMKCGFNCARSSTFLENEPSKFGTTSAGSWQTKKKEKAEEKKVAKKSNKKETASEKSSIVKSSTTTTVVKKMGTGGFI